MDPKDVQTTAERLFGKSFEAFMNEIPETYKRGTVMKLCLSSFKRRLDQEAAIEINNFKISYDAACELIWQKDCDLNDAIHENLELKAEIETLKEKIEAKVKANQFINDALRDKNRFHTSQVTNLRSEISELKKRNKDLQEVVDILSAKEQKKHRVLFPVLKFD